MITEQLNILKRIS
uniref:Uncharacterized protein n=1 Tax=Arundo donax TaxID=35708 RepID=A0A0A9FN65_ARUDO